MLAGLLVGTMTISGVAGAEQRVQQEQDMQVLLERSASSGDQQSNTDDQYAVQDSESSEKNEGSRSDEESPAPPDNDNPEGEQENEEQKDETTPGNDAAERKADVGGLDPARGAERSSRADGQPPRAANPEPSPESGRAASSSQSEPPRPERPNRATGASRSADGSEAVADRTVQSQRIQRRVGQLEERERAGEIRRAATSYGTERRPRELRIAREEIVAEPVDEAELRRYKELYEEAAEDYGFGEDWYVLAAVGKVESGHGQNMGPSSAGALGPMQFMPSTWEAYGVDANGDGKANIMDPEDAIPAAAKYLESGGAPDDWYEALFTYNHAGWYVEDVLEVAEGYRQAAGDDEVGPYYLEDR